MLSSTTSTGNSWYSVGTTSCLHSYTHSVTYAYSLPNLLTLRLCAFTCVTVLCASWHVAHVKIWKQGCTVRYGLVRIQRLAAIYFIVDFVWFLTTYWKCCQMFVSVLFSQCSSTIHLCCIARVCSQLVVIILTPFFLSAYHFTCCNKKLCNF